MSAVERHVLPTALQQAETARRLEDVAAALELLVRELSDGTRPPAPAARQSGDPLPLTHRQLEILGLIAQGRTTGQIARELWLSVATVRNHVARTLRALDAHSRLEAVANARRLGLLD